jgi:hypothetical protein
MASRELIHSRGSADRILDALGYPKDEWNEPARQEWYAKAALIIMGFVVLAGGIGITISAVVK